MTTTTWASSRVLMLVAGLAGLLSGAAGNSLIYLRIPPHGEYPGIVGPYSASPNRNLQGVFAVLDFWVNSSIPVDEHGEHQHTVHPAPCVVKQTDALSVAFWGALFSHHHIPHVDIYVFGDEQRIGATGTNLVAGGLATRYHLRDARVTSFSQSSVAGQTPLFQDTITFTGGSLEITSQTINGTATTASITAWDHWWSK